MTAMNPRFDQANFRVRVDTESPDGGTPDWNSWTENQAAAHVIDWDTTFRVRFTIQNDGNANSTDNFYLYAAKNGGSYTLVTTTSSGLQSDDASTVADGQSIATGNFLLTAGAGTASAGVYDETGTETATCNAGDYIEIEFGLSIDSADVIDGDYFDLRVYSDADGGGAVAFTDMTSPGTYDNTPRIEANANLTVTATGTIEWGGTDRLAAAGTAFDTTLRTTGVFFATAGHRFYDRSPSPFLNRGPPLEEAGGLKTATATSQFLADLAAASKSRAFGTSTITGDLAATGTSNAKATITVLGEGITDAVHLAQGTVTATFDLIAQNGTSFAFGTSTSTGELVSAGTQTAAGTSTSTGDLVSRGTSNAKATITVLGEGITDAVHLAQGTIELTGDVAAIGQSLGGIQSATGTSTFIGDLAAIGTSNAKATITVLGEGITDAVHLATGTATITGDLVAQNGTSFAFGTSTSAGDLAATAASRASGSIALTGDVIATGTTNAKATITILGEGITDAIHLASGTSTVLSEVAASGTQTASGTIALTGSLDAVGQDVSVDDLPAAGLIVNAPLVPRNQSTIGFGNERVLSQLATKTATSIFTANLAARGTDITAAAAPFTPIISVPEQALKSQSVLSLGKVGGIGITRAIGSITLTADFSALGVNLKPQGTITVIGSLRSSPGLEQVSGSISLSGDVAVRPTVTGVSTPVTLFIDEVPIKPSYVWLFQGTPPSKVASASISLDSSLSVGDDITQLAFGTITAIGSVTSSPEGVVPAKASVTPVTLIGDLSAVGRITDKPATATITVFGSADSVSGNIQTTATFGSTKNLILWSQEIDPVTHSEWIGVNALVGANATTAPDGTLTAERLTDDGSTEFGELSVKQLDIDFSSSNVYTASVYVKDDGLNWIRLEVNQDGELVWGYFKISDPSNPNQGLKGSVGGRLVKGTRITSVGNGWHRCDLFFDSDGPLPLTNAEFKVYAVDADQAIFIDLDGTSGIFVWQAQITNTANWAGIDVISLGTSGLEVRGIYGSLYGLGTRLIPFTTSSATITATGRLEGIGLQFTASRAAGVARFRATLAASESQGVGTRKGAFAELRVRGQLTAPPLRHLYDNGFYVASGSINVEANLIQAQLSEEPCTLGRGTIEVSGATMSAFGGDVNDKFVLGTISVSASLDISAIYARNLAMTWSASLDAHGRKLPIGNVSMLSRRAALLTNGRAGPGTIDGQKQKYINDAYGSLQIYNNSQGGFYTIGAYGITKEAFCLINVRMDMNVKGETDILKFAKGLSPMRITGVFDVANGTIFQGASMTIIGSGSLTAKGDHTNVTASISLTGAAAAIGESVNLDTVSLANRYIFNFTPAPGDTEAGIRIDNNGTIAVKGIVAGGIYSPAVYSEDTFNTDDWITPHSAASSAYRVRFTRLSGQIPTSAEEGYALDTWYSLATDQYVYNKAEATGQIGDIIFGDHKFSEILVEISIDEVEILASAIIELDAQAGDVE